MSLLHKLKDENYWEQFLQSKIESGHFSSREEKEFRDFIDNKKYLPIVEKILSNESFALPKMVEINKRRTGKKRTVFIFNHEENMVLKLLAHLLHDYDHLFSDNLYSFRKNISVKTAIGTLLSSIKKSSLYSYKVDIHDYFNSVDTDSIIKLLEETFEEDIELLNFIKSILLEPYCLKNGKQTFCKKGIMAGVPISGFLANLYLTDLDKWFALRGISYARYSDDIIVFAKTEKDIKEYEEKIKWFLSQKKLTVNPKKEVRTLPGEKWDFLGFNIDGNRVDVSNVALEKIRGKMRRKARAILRWRNRNNANVKGTIRAYIRHFNKKFYDNPNPNDLTWCRWYFPTITTAESLQALDEYMISCIRYISTGKHTKANYNLRYEDIKKLGYKSLVNSFYKFKKTGNFDF
ncbi:MAG: group II intron reverse transcriptase domain-containing protein [Clostridia bacterium]|nr:group II intron reverse transcriptase domain-containing protein [Clostridia bacterium]